MINNCLKKILIDRDIEGAIKYHSLLFSLFPLLCFFSASSLPLLCFSPSCLLFFIFIFLHPHPHPHLHLHPSPLPPPCNFSFFVSLLKNFLTLFQLHKISDL